MLPLFQKESGRIHFPTVFRLGYTLYSLVLCGGSSEVTPAKHKSTKSTWTWTWCYIVYTNIAMVADGTAGWVRVGIPKIMILRRVNRKQCFPNSPFPLYSLWRETQPMEGDTAYGGRHSLWRGTQPMEGDTAYGREHSLWRENTAYGGGHSLWRETQPMEGDTAYGGGEGESV